MERHALTLQRGLAGLILCCAAMQGPALAQGSGEVAARYPAGSISSVEAAERALAEASAARAKIEAEYAEEKRRCYPAFFMTSCLDHAAERRRQAVAQVRPVEIEAETFRRRARVEERDKELAERNARAAEDAARVASMPERTPKAAQDVPLADQVAEQRKREENIRAYERKQAEASIRLRERAAKQASTPD